MLQRKNGGISMAKHVYNPEDDDFLDRSIEEIRALADRQIEEYERRYEAQDKRNEMEQRYRNYEDQMIDIARSAARSFHLTGGNMIQHEMTREGKFFGTISGAAMSVALTVAAASAMNVYNSLMEEAQKDSTKTYQKDIAERITNANTNHQTTLNQYINDATERNDILIASQKTHYNDFKDIKVDANNEIQKAEELYRKNDNDLKREEKNIDNTYKTAIKEANDKLKAIENAYQKECEGLNQKTSDHNHSQAENANLTSQNNDKNESNLQKYTEQYEAAKKEVNNQIVKITETHNKAINDIKEKRNNLITQRNDIIDQQKNRIEDAKQEYVKKTETERKLSTNAEQKLQKFNDNNEALRSRALLSATRTNDRYEVQINAVGSKSAADFISKLNKTQENIGKDLIRHLGTDEEKSLFNKVQADIRAEKQAIKDGNIYTPLTTQKERDSAKKLIKKYGGNLSSEKDVKRTIEKMNTDIVALNKMNNAAMQKMSVEKQSLRQLTAQSKSIQQIIEKNNADKKMLRIGKDENGKVLTDKQKMEIKERLEKNGSMEKQIAILNKTKAEMNKKQNNINALQKAMNERNAIVTSILSRIDLLNDPKNVKAIVEAQKDKPKHNKMIEKSYYRRRASINQIKDSYHKKMYQGNAVQGSFDSFIKKTRKFERQYEKALKISRFTTKLLVSGTGKVLYFLGSPIRKLGKTQFAQKIIGSKAGRAVTKAASFAKGGVTLAGKGANALLDAPLLAQRQRRKQEQKKKEKYIAKQEAKRNKQVQRKEVRRLKKQNKYNSEAYKHKYMKKWAGIQNKIKVSRVDVRKGTTKFFDKVLGGKFGGFGKILSRLLSFILSMLFSLLASILSILVSALMFVLPIVLILLFVLMSAALLMSAVQAVSSWFTKHNSQENTYLKNQPQFIINQAVNYRNAELEIYELFNNVKVNNDNTLIPVTTSPIYYALYDNSFKLPWSDTGEFLKENGKNMTNEQAIALFESIVDYYDQQDDSMYGDSLRTDNILLLNKNGNKTIGLTTAKKDAFDFLAKYYDDITFGYYKYSDVYLGEDKQYHIINGAIPSEYELSNAKDVLAMVDALYMTNQDKMQEVEALSYLGVGEYQLGKKADNELVDNMFWKTHKFIYNSGTSVDDVYYCETREDGHGNYKCNGASTCNNKTTLIMTVDTIVDWESYALHTDAKECYKYDHPEETESETETTQASSSTEETEAFECKHIETKAIWGTKTFSFEICNGHIDLDVAIVVTTMADEDEFFYQASTIPKYNGDMDFSLLSFKHGTWTLGPTVFYPYNPSEDWAEDSFKREAAINKANVNGKYAIPPNNEASEISINIMRNKVVAQSLQKGPDRNLTLLIMIGQDQYYVDYFVSGEQKELIYHKYQNGSIIESGTMDIKIINQRANVQIHPK